MRGRRSPIAGLILAIYSMETVASLLALLYAVLSVFLNGEMQVDACFPFAEEKCSYLRCLVTS